MKRVGFPLLLALAFGCTSPMEAGHTDAGQGGTLPTAGGGGTSGSGLPEVGGSGGQVLVGTGGASGGVATSSGPGGSGGIPRAGTGGAAGGRVTRPGVGGTPRPGTGGGFGGVVTLPGSGGRGGTAGSSGSANLIVSTTTVSMGTIELHAGGVGSVTVTNTGRAATGSISVSASSGLVATGCSGILAPGASCAITIVATPASAGAFAGSVAIAANPGASPTPVYITVVATVIDVGVFTAVPPAIDLGPIPVGLLAPRQYITVAASASITDLSISPSGADVTIDVAATTCTASLFAGSSCVVAVNFQATTAGTKKDSIVITAGGANGRTITVPITAVAQNPAKLVITPPTAAFAAVAGQPSSAISFGVANIGDMPTGALSPTVTGPNASDFAITSSTCLVLAPLGTCTLSVVFKPGPNDGSAVSSATLTVTDAAAGGSSVTAILSGTRTVAPALVIYPSTTDLGQVNGGATGPATTFMLVNTGDTASGTITLAASSDELSITDDTCSGAVLAAKTGSCTFAVAFKPTSPGGRTMILTATDSNGPSVERVFTGNGIIP
jgi:hypothetical protein